MERERRGEQSNLQQGNEAQDVAEEQRLEGEPRPAARLVAELRPLAPGSGR